MRRPRRKLQFVLVLTAAIAAHAAPALASSCDYGYQRADQATAKKLPYVAGFAG